MTDWKSYLQSRSVISGIVAFLAIVLQMLGLGGIEDQAALVDTVLEFTAAGATLLTIFFRAIATKRLSLTGQPK